VSPGLWRSCCCPCQPLNVWHTPLSMGRCSALLPILARFSPPQDSHPQRTTCISDEPRHNSRRTRRRERHGESFTPPPTSFARVFWLDAERPLQRSLDLHGLISAIPKVRTTTGRATSSRSWLFAPICARCLHSWRHFSIWLQGSVGTFSSLSLIRCA
jgi:hypothetical protein